MRWLQRQALNYFFEHSNILVFELISTTTSHLISKLINRMCFRKKRLKSFQNYVSLYFRWNIFSSSLSSGKSASGLALVLSGQKLIIKQLLIKKHLISQFWTSDSSMKVIKWIDGISKDQSRHERKAEKGICRVRVQWCKTITQKVIRKLFQKFSRTKL